jgi:hypothetical protein
LQIGRLAQNAFEHSGRPVKLVEDSGERLAYVMRTIFRSLVLGSAWAISGASAQAVTVSFEGSNAFHGSPLSVSAAAGLLFLALSGFAAAGRRRLRTA